ncbi:homoserine O-acetyltransferase [Helicobacter monodelphidis]|uniref:homoserine O-acetyltransferase MetX n=1 Tax=Helicobacter sp. 15-1451 TaxID=2004995 RepID=UPI000DCD4BF6|nr:homoserine O-acetyltransferase [Helicobacter sp. 15-1451]RAX58818.1 homoserine O-acetyltransferase [Helicobacter sp. 15-1451]
MECPVTQFAHFTNPLYLDSGRILEPYTLAYETYGALNADKSNAILIMHAFSGSHHAAGVYEGEQKAGWWDSLIGHKKGIDIDRYFVICVNAIGSCYGSTSPMSLQHPSQIPYRLDFPVITIADMVRAQKILLSTLGIDYLKAVIGGSMGGMQALSFAQLYPKMAEHIFAIATTHCTSDYVIAAHKAMSEAIMNDPLFRAGQYESTEVAQMKGLAIARMIGFLQYFSPQTMQRKFSHRYVNQDGLYELFGRFEVMRYLDYNTQSFCHYFDPLSYLYLAKALCIYDLSLGYENLYDALKGVLSHIHIISFIDDTMFKVEESRQIAEALMYLQKKYNLLELQGSFGHDSFLVQVDLYDDYIRHILNS